MQPDVYELQSAINNCQICADRFALTATRHSPRPIVWFEPTAKILIAGQAPGMRVHKSRQPFSDPSGDRLRDWMGVTDDEFYDRSSVAIVPMAFCFPGYDAKGSDLPPPSICAKTWHEKVMKGLSGIRLRIFIGGHAHKWHLKSKVSVTETVAGWQSHDEGVFALPHPSWRNTGWIKRNPWFETELLPELRASVRNAIDE